MNTNDLKNLKNDVLKKVNGELKAKGVTVNNIEEDARAMSVQVGMVLHPICGGADDIKTGNPINGTDAQGRPTVNGFSYIDTVEGIRLTESQLTRLGNGLQLNGTKKIDRFVDFAAKCIDAKAANQKVEIRVVSKYANTLSNGQTQGLPVFSMTIA